MTSDLVNDLMRDKSWNPYLVCSDYVQNIPAPRKLPMHVPFEKAKPLSVNLNENDTCKSDIFIDDLISIGVDIHDSLQRLIAAPCSVMHAIAHNSSSTTFLVRDNFIADDKNDAEGAPEEAKIVLGWMINSRTLTVSLPPHKFIAWSSQIEEAMNQKFVSIDNI